jgi:hypothetical protein
MFGSGVGAAGSVRCDVESFGISLGGIDGLRISFGPGVCEGDERDVFVSPNHPAESFGGVVNETALMENVTSASVGAGLVLVLGLLDTGYSAVGRLGRSRGADGLIAVKEPSEDCHGGFGAPL